jgi:CRISP-associated protein Cas1
MALVSIAPLRDERRLPDYLPARMVNEYVYCPRLFFYEWVEGVWMESVDTVEGKLQHKRVDKPGKALPDPANWKSDSAGEELKTRAVTLSSERLRVIAKLDLLEVDSNGLTTPVDYKHGAPRELPGGGLGVWDPDRVQIALQAMLLKENGYRCEEALVFYQKTRQRVRIAVTPELEADAQRAVEAAWATARAGLLPPPLIDSPKCDGCSLAPVCLPEETLLLRRETDESGQLSLFTELEIPRKPAARETRRLLAARDEQRAVYLNTQGFRVGRSGDVLQVKEKEALRQELRLHEVSQVNVMGNVQLTTQSVQSLLEAEVPICYFSQGGWFYGMTTGLGTKNVFLRKAQFAMAGEDHFRLQLARQLVAGKIRNHRTMLMRNHLEPPSLVLEQIKRMAEAAERATSIEELLGIEGNGARLYFGEFAGMIKVEDGTGDGGQSAELNFDFTRRNRRPPQDPVNALLSLAYGILSKDLTIACAAVGFDPMIGFYHQPRFGRPALALDLMEPFRPLIAESVVLQTINTRRVTLKDFVRSGKAVSLTSDGRKAFFQVYEARMDSLVTHPVFGYRTSYRRLLELQTRLLAKYVEGSIGTYPVFVTR